MSRNVTRGIVSIIGASLAAASVLAAAPAIADVDSDGDGITDYWERDYGTDPFDANAYPIDLDKDGYPDYYELAQNTDPDDPASYPNGPVITPDPQQDSDGDGLYDVDETGVYGTNPDAWDTDGDGGSDGDEVYGGTDPNMFDDQTRADSDGDGLFDVDEQNLYGTDPFNFDSDGDGVGDGLEDDNGTDPTDGFDF